MIIRHFSSFIRSEVRLASVALEFMGGGVGWGRGRGVVAVMATGGAGGESMWCGVVRHGVVVVTGGSEMVWLVIARHWLSWLAPDPRAGRMRGRARGRVEKKKPKSEREAAREREEGGKTRWEKREKLSKKERNVLGKRNGGQNDIQWIEREKATRGGGGGGVTQV